MLFEDEEFVAVAGRADAEHRLLDLRDILMGMGGLERLQFGLEFGGEELGDDVGRLDGHARVFEQFSIEFDAGSIAVNEPEAGRRHRGFGPCDGKSFGGADELAAVNGADQDAEVVELAAVAEFRVGAPFD